MDKQKFEKYEQFVYELADKLPQWSSEDYERRRIAGISSILEELGEVSGLVSKYRTRKHYWRANAKSLDDFEAIKAKFIDELADTLWVMLAAHHALNVDEKYKIPRNSNIDVYAIFTDNQMWSDRTLEDALFTTIKYATELKSDLSDYVFSDLFICFSFLLEKMHIEYDITLDDLVDTNMKKLGNRYDADGNRTDGK